MKDDFRVRAGSISCLISDDEEYQRPIGGTLYFNMLHADPRYQSVEILLSTVLHEAFHSLFFDNVLFHLYPKNKQGKSAFFVDKTNTIHVRSDKFIQATKRHFECNFITFIHC